MRTTYIGIDVGKTGGIATIRPNGTITVSITPLIGKGKGSEIDVPRLKEILLSEQKELEFGDRLVVLIENVHAIQQGGASSAFQFGRSLGILEGLVTGMGITLIKIHAKVWQGVAFEGIPVVWKKSTTSKSGVSTDTKAMSKIACNRLYPTVDTRKSARAESAHDGICDALLIAHSGKVKGL